MWIALKLEVLFKMNKENFHILGVYGILRWIIKI